MLDLISHTAVNPAAVTATLPRMGLQHIWRSSLLFFRPVQLREAAAAAMARHKAEQPKQATERAIDILGQASGRQAQHAKRGQRQYRQRGGDDELEGDVLPEAALPNQAAGVAAAARLQEQEYEARARAKRARGTLLYWQLHCSACAPQALSRDSKLCSGSCRGVILLAAPVVCTCVSPRHMCLPLPCHWLVVNPLHVLLRCTSFASTPCFSSSACQCTWMML